MKTITVLNVVILIMLCICVTIAGSCSKKGTSDSGSSGNESKGQNVNLPNTDPVVIKINLQDLSSGWPQNNGWQLVCSYQWRGGGTSAGSAKSITSVTNQDGEVIFYVPYEAWYTTLGFAIAIKETPAGIDWNNPKFPYTSTWSEEWLTSPGTSRDINVNVWPKYVQYFPFF